jgi:hypothetical protein
VLTDPQIEVLAARSEGFSGAELEQAVVSAMYSANSNHKACDASLIAAELQATRPLSVVMAEKVAELRHWAKERTVPAD